MRGKLVGRWGPTLPPSQAHDVTTARAALADPPDDAAFEAMNPTADDRDKYKALIELKTADPTNPRLDAVKRSLHEYESMLVEITLDAFQWRTPTRSDNYRYSVISETADM